MSEQIERQLAEVNKNLLHLAARLDQLQSRQSGTLLVVSWLLAKYPQDEALQFLMAQGAEVSGNPELAEHEAVLAELAEDVQHWHVVFADNTRSGR
jgi:hypothetical protein